MIRKKDILFLNLLIEKVCFFNSKRYWNFSNFLLEKVEFHHKCFLYIF